MPMRLGFHYHIPVTRTPDGSLWMPGYLGRFLDSLAPLCQSVIYFAHSAGASALSEMDYQIRAPNLVWVDLGPLASVPRRNLFADRYVQPLRLHRHEIDIMLIRGPSPLLPAMVRAARPLPTALLIVGNYTTGIDDLPQPWWRKQAIRMWSHWNHWQQLRTARQTLTFVNSQQLFELFQPHLPNLRQTRTTTLSAQDFHERVDTCQAAPYRMLYTGRLSKTKGLLELVDALAALVNEGRDVVLDLVGWPEIGNNGESILDELEVRATQQNVASRVFFHGPKALGEELFRYYRGADVYVIPSYAEGFPRTIWEAMANCLPVVATSVGSIPYFLTHETHALLVTPKDSDSLRRAISRILDDATLRQRLIANGFALAQENTLEARAQELIEQLKEWIVHEKNPA